MEINENENSPEQNGKIYNERLHYSGELTQRLGRVMDAMESHQYAFEALSNLVSILLPVVKFEVGAQLNALNKTYHRQAAVFQGTTYTLPHPPARGVGGFVIHHDMLFHPRNTRGTDWNSLLPDVREIFFHYYRSGETIHAPEAIRLSFYPFARRALDIITASCDRHGLLLHGNKPIDSGGFSLMEATSDDQL